MMPILVGVAIVRRTNPLLKGQIGNIRRIDEEVSDTPLMSL